jgi:hypothetical protein
VFLIYFPIPTFVSDAPITTAHNPNKVPRLRIRFAARFGYSARDDGGSWKQCPLKCARFTFATNLRALQRIPGKKSPLHRLDG